jgi:Fe-S cluster assembly ATP-binding protein
MGPNGSGKSTLAQVLSGRDAFTATQGQVLFQGQDLLAMEPEERACAGLFMAFQYPVEIPGVSGMQFLRSAVNALRKAKGEEALDAMDLTKRFREKAKMVQLDDELLKRSVNAGFSGGEKKRNEIFQMAVLEPTLAVLDETDSGLDIDALRAVAQGVDQMRTEERSFLLITHYQRLLDHVQPDCVHVLMEGQIVRSGDKELARELERNGYAAFAPEGAGTKEQAPAAS